MALEAKEALQVKLRSVSVLSVILLVLPLSAAFPTSATHVAGYPDCVNTVAAAAPASYDVGRIRASGYGYGTVGLIDLGIVDAITPSPVPDVFEAEPSDGRQVLEVAGALVSVSFDGLPNTFLNGGPPVTEVAESAFPLDIGSTTTHAGAQTLNMVFDGRVTVYPPESFYCGSVERANTYYKFTTQRVEFDGWATAITTADDDALEPWGVGTDIVVGPGDTSNL